MGLRAMNAGDRRRFWKLAEMGRKVLWRADVLCLVVVPPRRRDGIMTRWQIFLHSLFLVWRLYCC